MLLVTGNLTFVALINSVSQTRKIPESEECTKSLGLVDFVNIASR